MLSNTAEQIADRNLTGIISGININGSKVVLFQVNEGTVSSIFLKDSTLTATTAMGGIAVSSTGTIEGCMIYGDVKLQMNGDADVDVDGDDEVSVVVPVAEVPEKAGAT